MTGSSARCSKELLRRVDRAAAAVLRAAVHAYRVGLGWALGGHCRFVPSCSSFALEALERHGALRGAGLTLRRLARCHPLHPGGVDPVP